jgi:hypothetical protein
VDALAVLLAAGERACMSVDELGRRMAEVEARGAPA